MKHILTILTALFLISCSERTDYSQPHEYIKPLSYGGGYVSLEGNDYQYSGIGVIPKTNRFPINEGKCESYIKNIKKKKVDLSIQGFNYYIRTDHLNDKFVRHAKFVCVQYKGEKKGCREHYQKETQRYIKENKLTGAEAARAILLIDMETYSRCRNEEVIGETEMFHTYGYEDDSYID
ncbi:hypothetical protein RI845_16820 [Thalassotalea nanhaiensis]|uniref:Lipoprotein n=1 Tax=Thalassotalea nanhaiensis TaxID=3065648 RepID=A0ABY9TH97_9GAMM|nr:hypothetical protein RI845_16820 [Colwelliaceae bacterium SQ345]